MELEYKKEEIIFNKEINNLDKFVFSFTKILEKEEINYVIISGYIAILFGRSRNTEDVDLFVDKLDREKFKSLWKEILSNGFECTNTPSEDTAYEILQDDSSIRFATKGHFVPNIEVKFTKTILDKSSLQNRIKVCINKEHLYTSSLEIQIAYKIYLGSDKDIEDAKHLWILFKEHLNIDKLKYLAYLLGVDKEGIQNVIG